MKKLKRINILSLAKLQAVLLGLLGLIAGVLYGVGGFIIDVLVSLEWITTTETPGLSYGTVLAFGALVGMPIIGLVIGFVMGIVEGVIYNVFAKWFARVHLDIEKK